MFGSNSPYSFETDSYSGSIQSNGFSTMDETSSQMSNLSKPSAKSIYLQRMEYAASMNKMLERFQYKVEHLFTCDMDGKDLRNIRDCLERLKLLDHMGRIWGQSMMLELRSSDLLLTDIETKEELESISLRDVQDLQAVLDGEVFNSLLIVPVQNNKKQITTVFMFQCDELRADYIQRDLTRGMSEKRDDSTLSLYAKVTHDRGQMKAADQTPADYLEKRWTAAENGENHSPEPELHILRQDDEEDEAASHMKRQPSPLPSTLTSPHSYTELDRNVDILNHIVTDVEIFMGKIGAIEAKSGKKKRKKKKGKGQDKMPPDEEFAACFHKIKSGFNLLGELNGKINNPSAPDFVHSLFSALAFVVHHCDENLPKTIIAPLLSPQCIRLLSEEASAEEDELWQSLGDAWNIPSTKWPEDDEDIPTYTLEFSDGWQPPQVTAAPALSEHERRQESPRPGPSPKPSHPAALNTNGQTPARWRPPKPPQEARSNEVKLRDMRVKSDFISRNHRELTVRRGEMVELLDMSKQWWKVRNSQGEEGYVPNNIMEAADDLFNQETDAIPVLTRRSKPAEVKAWLEDKGFNQITVRCLGVLSGPVLLGMSREELKSVCPEEGGRVFFQLQAVKTALADAS